MDIALVSYEYSGVARGGGIGTYVRNAASMLAARGHRVEVFTEGAERSVKFDGATVHSVPVERRSAFPEAILPTFRARHELAPFDLVESPEYGRDGVAIAMAYPTLPLVVKLHTPTSLIDEINHRFVPWTRKARYLAGRLVRGRAPKPFWVYDPATDQERTFTRGAHEVTSPSECLLALMRDRWALDPERLSHVPNVFVPNEELLDVAPASETQRVTFIGKLEVRKGVVELGEAIPHVLAAAPGTRFRLIGRSLPHPGTGEDLGTLLRDRLGRHAAAVEFVGAVPYDQIPAYYADTDICVFPSIFEAAGYVCQEAMAAARGIVASASGGMAEMIDDRKTGLLVEPGNSRRLADAIVRLVADPQGRIRMGEAARAHVLGAYSAEAVVPVQEASYRRAIVRAADAERRPAPTATPD